LFFAFASARFDADAAIVTDPAAAKRQPGAKEMLDLFDPSA
jgi:hypothetical protein